MNAKEIRELQEAYLGVYAPQEVEEEMKSLPKEKMDRQAQKAYKKERGAIDRRDDDEANRQMQRRIAMQSPATRRNVLQNKKMEEELEIEEAVKGADLEMRRAGAADRRAGNKPLSVTKGRQNADKMQRDINFYDKLTKKEEFDIFDTVLEFLQVEGYAETLEDAEWLMSNIIDEEAIGIIIGEGYQRTPEKSENEDKKYAPVRGEKTPMPPRGNKKREDFEKWYAANVR